MNLLALLKDNLSPEMISKVANLVGEDTGKTAIAISGILPVIMGGVVEKASTTEGATGIMSMLSSGGHDGRMMNNLGSMLSGGSSTDGVMASGSGILSSLFGDKISGIVNVISNFAGIKSGSANSLLSLAAPMVMGIIGKQVSGSNMSSNGLMSLLTSQKDHVADAMPAGLGDKLGGLLRFGSMFGGATSIGSGMANDASETVSDATNYSREKVEDTSSGLSKWLLPLLIGAAAIAGLLYFMKGCNKTPEVVLNSSDSLSTGMSAEMDTMASSASRAMSSATDAVKKNSC